MNNAGFIKSICEMVMKRSSNLDDHIKYILENNGGRKKLKDSSISVFDVHNYNGMSGHNFWDGDTLIAQLYIGSLISGTYFIYKRTFVNQVISEKYDYYDGEGRFFYESSTLDGQTVSYDHVLMDPTSPFINHLYNILACEYSETTFNFGNTARIQLLEDILNKLYHDANFYLSAEKKLKDEAIVRIGDEIIRVEDNPVLKWHERQTIFKQLKQTRSKLLATKRRVHKFHYLLYDLLILLKDIGVKFQTFKKRPLNNFMGLLFKWTIGNLIWFVNTVRSNMGYSLAMAIYGPFTFYFITQPMNPHAMWAVGKVRNAYIETVNSLSTVGEEKEEDKKKEQQTQDSVKTSFAATQKVLNIKKDMGWGERMDEFKAMQIAYEEAMVFAERMGREEQHNNQLNFHLTAEAAWMEMELYLSELEEKKKYHRNLDVRLLNFLNNEKERTLKLQIYLWRKLGQFFIDYPYIVVDEDEEQTQRNYYLGRQFVLFKRMTEKLAKMGVSKNPETHYKVNQLAKHFSEQKVEGSSVLDTLKKNSKVFQQRDYLNSDEHREYMKRHWEILFVQQNKKQEASSFALMMYTGSVKNTMWLLQTFYSAKRSELWKLVANYDLDGKSRKKYTPSATMDEYLGTMFNNLVMEYVSIKKEIVANLKGDNEAFLREKVIQNIKSYLIERDKLFSQDNFALNDRTSK